MNRSRNRWLRLYLLVACCLLSLLGCGVFVIEAGGVLTIWADVVQIWSEVWGWVFFAVSVVSVAVFITVGPKWRRVGKFLLFTFPIILLVVFAAIIYSLQANGHTFWGSTNLPTPTPTTAEVATSVIVTPSPTLTVVSTPVSVSTPYPRHTVNQKGTYVGNLSNLAGYCTDHYPGSAIAIYLNEWVCTLSDSKVYIDMDRACDEAYVSQYPSGGLIAYSATLNPRGYECYQKAG